MTTETTNITMAEALQMGADILKMEDKERYISMGWLLAMQTKIALEQAEASEKPAS